MTGGGCLGLASSHIVPGGPMDPRLVLFLRMLLMPVLVEMRGIEMCGRILCIMIWHLEFQSRGRRDARDVGDVEAGIGAGQQKLELALELELELEQLEIRLATG